MSLKLDEAAVLGSQRKWFSLIILLLVMNFYGLTKSSKVVDVDRVELRHLEPCGNRSYNLRLVENHFKALGRGLVALDGVWEVTEDIGNITKALMKMTKCKSMLERETCEYFTTVKQRNICRQLVEPHQLWSNLFRNVSPPFVCPIKKGRYVLKNGLMDSSALASNPALKGFYWEIQQKVYGKNDKLIFCYTVGMEIKTSRRRLPSTTSIV